MAYRGHEIVLELVELLEPLVRGSQLVGRGFELLALFLQPPAVNDELGGLVQDLHDLVDIVHFLPQHRGDHDARRGRADGARELALDIGHDIGIRRARVVEAAVALARKALECRLGQRLADEAGEQTPQISDRRPTAPNPFSGGPSAEDVHELVGLAALDDGLRGHQRDRDIKPDIDDHRPEHGMGDRIEAGKTEQLVRTQQGDAEWALVHEALGDPAGAGEGRQQQRVDPDHKAAGKPGQRPRPGRPGPKNAPDDRRRELRGRHEGDQPDGDKRIGLADEPHIRVAEQHDHHDGPAPDRQQHASQIAALRQMQAAEPEQRRHDEVVAHHGAQRDGLDDDHAGRGGKPADEGKQRNRLLVLGHRQRQHECVGVHAAAREMEQAAEGDRQHEDIDKQQIEGKQPDRLLDVPLVDVLDHEHLELSRQYEDRQHGEQGERDPAGVAGAWHRW